jgi:hypothetical protein
MGLRPTHCNENGFELVGVRSVRRGTVKVVETLDEERPHQSLVWNARFEPICVAPLVPSGKGGST